MHRKLSILVLVKFLIRLPQNDERAREKNKHNKNLNFDIIYFRYHILSKTI